MATVSEVYEASHDATDRAVEMEAAVAAAYEAGAYAAGVAFGFGEHELGERARELNRAAYAAATEAARAETAAAGGTAVASATEAEVFFDALGNFCDKQEWPWDDPAYEAAKAWGAAGAAVAWFAFGGLRGTRAGGR